MPKKSENVPLELLKLLKKECLVMIKRNEKSNKYDVRKAIVHKLTRNQLFLLCIAFVIALAIIGIYAPSALIGLF